MLNSGLFLIPRNHFFSISFSFYPSSFNLYPSTFTLSSSSAPIQGAFFPNVGVSRSQNGNVHKHLPKPGPFQALVYHRPRIQEDSLNVKQDEKHSHQIETDREALAGIAHRRDATFIRG